MKNLTKILFLSVLLVCITYKSHSQNDPEKVKAGIMKVYDLFNTYQLDKLSDYIDENYIDHSPDPGQKPGLAGLKESFVDFKKGFPDYKFTANDIIVNSTGDKASVLFTFTGTNSGEMMGMKPTNKSVNVQGIDYLYFTNGKCTERWGYIDMNAMMSQLGMMQQTPPDKK